MQQYSSLPVGWSGRSTRVFRQKWETVLVRDCMSTANDRESSDRRDLLARILAEVADGARDTAAIRAVRKRVTKQTAQWDRADLLALAHELIGRASYGRFMAYELVRYHAGTMRSIDRTEVEALGAGIG